QNRQSTVVMRLQRAADQYVLLTRQVNEKEKAQLLAHGFRAVDRETKARDRTIFNDQAYIGYAVANDGPTQSELNRMLKKAVKVRSQPVPHGGAAVVGIDLAGEK